MRASMVRAGEHVRPRFARCLITVAAGIVAACLPAFTPAASGSQSRAAQPCPGAGTSAKRQSSASIRSAIVCLIARRRAADDLPPLRESASLDRSAQAWTNAMVSRGYFSHGTSLGARISAAGFRWASAGEDIATGLQTPRAVVNTWMHSLGHCQVILDPSFAFVGIGVNRHPVPGYARRPATWTLDAALPSGMRAPSGNWAPANSCPH